MKCAECGHDEEQKEFLGWPVRMWYDIRNHLQELASSPSESPLATLSRMEMQAPRAESGKGDGDG